MFPAEQATEAEPLDVHLLETLELLCGLAGRPEINRSLGDSVDIAGGRQEVVTEQVMREHDAVEDVLLRQAGDLAYVPDLDSITGDHGGVGADGSPGDYCFSLIVHCLEHTLPQGPDEVVRL